MKISYSTSVAAVLCGRPLRKRFLNLAIRLLSFLRLLSQGQARPRKSGDRNPCPFCNANGWIPVPRLRTSRTSFTGMTRPKFKGRLGGILGQSLDSRSPIKDFEDKFHGNDIRGKAYFPGNSKGISVLFLVIALLLMVTIGYVLSYMIPVKQKSVKFPIYSTQAFYIAQSGMDYGVRYCSDQGWRGATDTGRLDYDRLNDSGVNQRSIVIGKVDGKFTINYDTGTKILTSTGEINNSTEKRAVRVSNFDQFLRLTFTSSPCWISGYSNQRAQFEIRRWRGTTVTLTAFSATWQEDTVPARNITTIRFGNNTRFSGTYSNGSGIVYFSANQNVGTGGVNVEIRWNAAMTNPRNIVITFYTAAGVPLGEGFKFNLDPEGNNLPGCY